LIEGALSHRSMVADDDRHLAGLIDLDAGNLQASCLDST
jgi:hypothetical protein